MDYDDAITQLSELLNLSDDAIAIAEGWSILPTDAQRHVNLLINDYVAKLIPPVAPLYENAFGTDQLRFNRVIERHQAQTREPPETE